MKTIDWRCGRATRPPPHGQSPAIAWNSARSSSRSPVMSNAIARFDLQMGFAQGEAPFGRRDPEVVDDDRFLVTPVQLDLALTFADLVDRHQRRAEARDAQQRRPPVGDAGEIVGEPSQRLLHLVEGADDHHQLAEGHVAVEIRRRGDQDRRDDRQPTETRRHARQPGRRQDDLIEDLDDAAEDPIEALLLVGFAAVERDAFDLLVDPHQREAKLRLAGVALGIQMDQRTADAPTHQRGDRRNRAARTTPCSPARRRHVRRS